VENIGDLELDWHADTEDTHHITLDMDNLNLRNEEYNGPNHFLVGNGQGLHISKIEKYILHNFNHHFILNHVVLVPKIKKK